MPHKKGASIRYAARASRFLGADSAATQIKASKRHGSVKARGSCTHGTDDDEGPSAGKLPPGFLSPGTKERPGWGRAKISRCQDFHAEEAPLGLVLAAARHQGDAPQA